MARPPTLVVNEVYGPVFQGEGPSMGRRAGFIRLMGCNLTCDWCDTPYTWDGMRYDLRKEGRRMSVRAILHKVTEGRPELAVITGGEPMLHQGQEAWVPLLDALVGDGLKIEIETNGTVMPTEPTMNRIYRFNVSPKLSHSGDEGKKRINTDILRAYVLTGEAVFKFVCNDWLDFREVEMIIKSSDIPSELVWIMPQGRDAETVQQRFAEMAPEAIKRGWNITTRLHVLAYGDKRGV